MRLLLPALLVFLLVLAAPKEGFSLSPSIKIHSPESKTYSSADILLNVSTDMVSTVAYSLNSQPYQTLYANNISGNAIIKASQGANTITISAAANGTDQSAATQSFSVQPFQPTCSINVKGLSAQGDFAVFTVENTGTSEQDIDYSVKINLNKTHTGKEKVAAGQKKEVRNGYIFKIGSYQLEASATSSCGASDVDITSYSKTGPSACTNPGAVHDTFRANSTEGKTYRCNNGVWEIVQPFTNANQKYCSSANRCGDGVLNCGETAQTCPADYNSSFAKCDCANKKFFADNRLVSPGEFFGFCKANCSLECLSDFSCKTGDECRNFFCLPKPGKCGVRINDFDYTQQVGLNETGFVFATIKNTGLITENITTKVFLMNNPVNASWVLMNPDSENLQNFFYRSGFIGNHELKLEASSDCGSSDSKQATVNIRGVVSVAAQKLLLETDAKLPAEKIDLAPGFEKALTISLKTSQPQIFTIKVTGVPADWLDYPSVVGITEDRDINIFLKPSQEGAYNMTIEVHGSDKTFAQTSALNITSPEKPAQLGLDPIAAAVILVLAFAGIFYIGIRQLEF